jgi:hypothetical protein
MDRLMLKVLDWLEYFLTRTIDRAEVAADSIAKAVPIMPSHVDKAIIKIILRIALQDFLFCVL